MSEPIWSPSPVSITNSNMGKFISYVNNKHQLTINDYDTLYQWSIDHMDHFWLALSEFCYVRFTTPHQTVLKNPHKMPGATWFEGATLNFAENLLSRNDDKLALIFKTEQGPKRQLTYGELYQQVAKLSHH